MLALKFAKKGKKKKDGVKVRKFKGNGLRIVDDEDYSFGRNKNKTSKDSDDDYEEHQNAEELPSIAAVVDERPVEVQALEEFQKGKWKQVGMKPAFGPLGFDDSRRRHDSEGSPDTSRRRRHDSGDLSPPRSSRRRHAAGDLSPPRIRKRHKAGDISLSPDKSVDSGDLSPLLNPRRHDSGDLSSPRNRKRHDSGDLSPTRNRKRHDSGDLSPTRNSKRHDSGDLSPPRNRKKHDSGDLSPPRNRKRHDSGDLSPPRIRRSDNSGDMSPPRSRQRLDPEDLSPPRRRQRYTSGNLSSSRQSSSQKRDRRKDDDDLSPSRSVSSRNDKSGDMSPPRKSFNKSQDFRRRTANPEIVSLPDKTLDGKRAGLQRASDLRKEMVDFRKKENEIFATLDDEFSGRLAKTKIRDRKTGKERDFAAELAVKEEEDKIATEKKKLYEQWGKGLKQVQDQSNRREDALRESSKPLARYANDEDLDVFLKEQDRDGDPMLKFLSKKTSAGRRGDKPLYQGPPPMPNRFGVPPGYRWDGVDRSSGYEKEWFSRINARKAVQEEAYKWSVEDL